MEIAGNFYNVIDTFDNIVTVPDCFVCGKNKLGHGHGEAKLYFGTKENARSFFGGEGFDVDCFVLKKDLIVYLETLREEYFQPSQNYFRKDDFPKLWKERMDVIQKSNDVIWFKIQDQIQIEGSRGYINSKDKEYKLIRELSLPLVSYISAMQLKDLKDNIFYYWKLFVDFDAISERKNGPLVFTYGMKKEWKKSPTKKISKKDDEIRYARIGQGKYRNALLEECPFCPITMVNDERLLIASHIKPWAIANDKEKLDSKNGYMFTPLYDKLFDRGFITFTDDKHIKISNWLSPKNCERLKLVDNTFYPHLPMDELRKKYLMYHRESVFKG
ncbi:MAG: hypothetical protein RRX93_04785 [Bacteroidales bacterium]